MSSGGRTMRLKPYLQLIRLPNVFTAAADSLAGWLLATGSFDAPERWLPLVAASMAIYAAGITLNDVFDYEIDLRERPGRPLPSGKVSRRFALWAGSGLLVLGPLLAALSGSPRSTAVAALLAACVLAYDGGLKKTPLGPEAMGACRGLNLLLGMSQADRLGGPNGWLVAASLALFVTGVTWISRSETETGRSPGLILGVALENAAFLGLLAATLGPWAAGAAGSGAATWYPAVGILMLLAVAWTVNRAAGRAIREPVPLRLQSAVKTGVLSLVWLNFSVVAAIRGPAHAAAIAVLWVPAYGLSRWLYAT